MQRCAQEFEKGGQVKWRAKKGLHALRLFFHLTPRKFGAFVCGRVAAPPGYAPGMVLFILLAGYTCPLLGNENNMVGLRKVTLKSYDNLSPIQTHFAIQSRRPFATTIFRKFQRRCGFSFNSSFK